MSVNQTAQTMLTPADEAHLKKTIVAVAHRLYQKNMVVSNDGNISVRCVDGIWTTPTGVCKGDLAEDMLVKVDKDGHILYGHYRPSSELKMHLQVYHENETVMAVVHAHPLAATSFAVAGIALDLPILPEAIVHLGSVPVAPYAVPGTEAVALSIKPYCCHYNGLLLANHGALTWGTDLWQAYFRMESLEYYAQITLNTTCLLQKPRLLSQEEIAASLQSRKSWGITAGGIPRGYNEESEQI